MKAKGVEVESRVLFAESMSSGSEEKSRIYQPVRSGLWIRAKGFSADCQDVVRCGRFSAHVK